MKENPDDDIQKLIRLKRFEKPDESYFEDFLRDFQCRQRSELLHRSAHGLFCERLATYVSGFGRTQLVMGAGAAAAVTIVFAYYVRSETSDGIVQPNAIPSSHLWDGSYDIPHPQVEPISEQLDPDRVSIGGAVRASMQSDL